MNGGNAAYGRTSMPSAHVRRQSESESMCQALLARPAWMKLVTVGVTCSSSFNPEVSFGAGSQPASCHFQCFSPGQQLPSRSLVAALCDSSSGLPQIDHLNFLFAFYSWILAACLHVALSMLSERLMGMQWCLL